MCVRSNRVGCRYISQRAHLLVCDQFSWTTKLVQFCSWLYLDWLRGSGVGEAICLWWSTGALSCTVSIGSTDWSTSFTVWEVFTDSTRLPLQTRTSSPWIILLSLGGNFFLTSEKHQLTERIKNKVALNLGKDQDFEELQGKLKTLWDISYSKHHKLERSTSCSWK